MGKTTIEWTSGPNGEPGYTANLWWGCTEVHAGCDNCYARIFSHRYDGGNSLWGDVKRRRINSVFPNLDKYQRDAEKVGEIHRVFVGSMMDIFEKSMPLMNPVDRFKETGDIRDELLFRIAEFRYPNLLFLLLTKRPSNILKMIPKKWTYDPPVNVMYGTSPVDQKTADTLIPQLMRVPGRTFLSIEPQLSEIDISDWFGLYQHDDGAYALKVGSRWDNSPDWIIQGGESGHHKRPFDITWARSLRDQCAAAGVPYFFKQIDKVKEIPSDLLIRQFPT